MYRLIPKPKMSLYWRVMIGLMVITVPLVWYDVHQMRLVLYALIGF